MSGFTVRESGRAKRLSIKVFPRGRVEVVVPKRTSAREVKAFVESNRRWIDDARATFAREHPPEPFVLPDRIVLDGIEAEYQVSYVPLEGAKSVRYRAGDGTLRLTGKTTDESLCVDALKRWLCSVARAEFMPRLSALSALTGNSFLKMQVRGQRSCWGSHSSNGTISLNYCLLFLAPEHLRYVLIHELCHAQHMNHSRRFWSLVESYEPDYKRLDKDLNSSWKKIPSWVGIY